MPDTPAPEAPPARFDAVFFDLGNTLVHLDYAWLAQALTRLADAPVDAAELAGVEAAVRRDGWQEEAVSALPPGQRLFRAYMGEVGRRLGLGGEAALALADAAYAEHTARPLGLWHVPDPDARAVLVALRRSDVRTGVISNNDGRARAEVAALGLADLFDVVVDSATAGARKPDPRIFAHALAALGVQPARAAHVGDSYHDDVAGARSAGLTPVLFDPGGLWRREGLLTIRRLAQVVDLVLAAPL